MPERSREKESQQMPKQVFIFFGPPTSGKTTQALYFEETTHARRIQAKDIVIGSAEEYERTRDLVPDEIFLPALEDTLRKVQSPILVFDNLPRTVKQAETIAMWANRNGIELHAVELQLTEEEVVQRALDRYVCPCCNESYHPEIKPSKALGKCDKDQAELVRKKGDKPEVVAKGAREYFERETPIIEALSLTATIHKVSAQGTTVETAERMFTDLSPHIFADPEMAGKYFEFRAMLEGIKVPHIFISGMPVFLYGGRALMKDMDILVPDTDIDVIAQKFGKEVEDLSSNVANTRYVEVSGGLEIVSNLEVTSGGQAIPFTFEMLAESANETRFMGVPIKLMGVEDLILFKTALGRFGFDDWGKMKDDLSDVQGLVGVQNINWDKLYTQAGNLGMIERLEEKLAQINITPPWLSENGQVRKSFY